MTKISILYTNHKSSRFDMPSTSKRTCHWRFGLLGSQPGYQRVSVERGIGGAEPGTDAPFVVMCPFSFDSMENSMAAFTAHAATLRGDVPNYTEAKPVIHVSEVLISR
jgi:uncharacterized protein (TIGR02118 family)